MSLLDSIVSSIVERHDQFSAAKYLAVVSWTLLGYDWIISIDLEAAFIWGSPWTLGRFVYHFNRIWPLVLFGTAIPMFLFAPLPQPMTCRKATLYYAYGLIVELSGVCSVLLMRCWALYDSKRILSGLSAGFFLTVLATTIMVKMTMDEVAYFPNPVPEVFTGCLILLPRRVWTIYIVPLIYDTTMFGMTVHRIWVLSREFGSTPLMSRLAKNGALHSAVLIALMLFSCIGGTSEAVKIASNGSGVLGAISSVVCSRIIFSLHALAEEEARNRFLTSRGGTTGGDTRFAVPMRDLSTFGTIGTGLGRETDRAGETNQQPS